MKTTDERFRPQTATERAMLAECAGIAGMHGCDVSDVLVDAVKYWQTAGRSRHPRLWASRAAAADRLLARGQAIAEHAVLGIDPFVEIEGFASMTAEELRDEVVYLGDHQDR